MRSTRIPMCLSLLVACDLNPPGGTQIGALRVDPPPAPPTDFKDLDMVEAVDEAFGVAGVATLATAWAGHIASMDRATFACPSVWLGLPPEDLADLDMDEDASGLSWADDCQTPNRDAFEGFAYWQTTMDPIGGTGSRSLQMDGSVLDGGGALLLSFDGEADDSLTGNTYTTNLVARDLSGSLLGLGSGLRGELDAEWSPTDLELTGAVHLNDGFGPPDDRDPDTDVTPELANHPGWEPGMPRFTSVRYELEFGDDCALEPRGYLGVRGNEGFWFDVYFLPLFDAEEDPAAAAAYPYEDIDNIECDGIGTLFVRNLDLRQEDEDDPNWSREIEVDFPTILANLPTPALDSFIYTLQDLPEDPP